MARSNTLSVNRDELVKAIAEIVDAKVAQALRNNAEGKPAYQAREAVKAEPKEDVLTIAGLEIKLDRTSGKGTAFSKNHRFLLTDKQGNKVWCFGAMFAPAGEDAVTKAEFIAQVTAI